MSRAGRSASAQLMDHVVGAGQLTPLRSFLATTFELDPDFLEYDFVPSMIGLSQRDDRSTRARLQLEEQLARLDAAVVMMDANCYRGARPCSLRVHLTAKQKRGVKLHAKVALFVHEDCVRLLLGSANLTANGYRSNREVAYSLSASEKKPEAARLMHQAIEPMHRILSSWWSQQASTVQQQAIHLLNQWIASAQPIEQERFVWSGAGQPLWRAFAEAWPRGQALERLTIVSPFWSHESERGPVEGLLRALRERGARTVGAKVELLAGAIASSEGVYVPQAHPSFGDVDFRKLGIAASLHAVDPRILEEGYEKDARLRPLHAKVVLASGEDTTVAYSGSANFTRRGWGFDAGAANVEAGIILVREGKSARALQSLRPQTSGAGQPLDGSGSLVQAPPLNMSLAPDWPWFVHLAELRPRSNVEGELALIVAFTQEAPVTELIVATDSLPEPLWVGAPMRGEAVEVPLTPEQFRALLIERQLLLRWSADGAAAVAHFPLNVSVIAREQLPFSNSASMIGEHELVAFYQGRLSFEDLFPHEAAEGATSADGDTSEGETSTVDTSRILSYQIREFVDALPGLRQELERTTSTAASIRLAFLGPVSPLALARSVEQEHKAGRSATAAAFQLLELQLCLRQAQVPALKDPLLAQAWEAARSEADGKLCLTLERLLQSAPEVQRSSRFVKYRDLLSNWGAA